jgi:hypothetical protein
LGERLLCKQEVIGSIPFTSTRSWLEGWTGSKSATTTKSQKQATAFASGFLTGRRGFGISIPRRRLLFKNLEEVKCIDSPKAGLDDVIRL